MIIGFSHKARVGKDTAGDYLRDTYVFHKLSFAGPLKEGIGKCIFGFTDEQMESGKEVKDPFWGMTPREVLQKAGTEYGRGVFGDDMWVKALKRKIDQNTTYNYAISDVRYKNEADAIKSWGGVVVRIDRNIVGTNSQHISEVDLVDYIGWDAVLDNNGTKEALYHQLDLLVAKHLYPQEVAPVIIPIKDIETTKGVS